MMNKILLFLILSLGLHANYAQSMETQKANLLTAFKNSPAAQWINKYKMPLIATTTGIIIGGAIGEYLFNYYVNTPERLKQMVKKRYAERIGQATLELRDSYNNDPTERWTRLADPDPYYGFTIDIVVDTNQENKLRYLVEYRYNCDNSTETGEIFFEDEDQKQAALNSRGIIPHE
jgi:hypothetical protein